MSQLQVKTNIDNGDLPKDFKKKPKLKPITPGNCKIELKDMFNPTVLRAWFNKQNKQFSYVPSMKKGGLTKAPLSFNYGINRKEQNE